MAAVPLQYRFDGSPGRPVVLLIPPFGTKWSVWEPQMPELTRARCVLRVNHRGHGGSPPPDAGTGVADLGADVAAVLDAEGIEKVSVVGAGLGGLLATWLAVHRPERVHRLAYVAGAARVPRADDFFELAERVRADGMPTVRHRVGACWFTPGFAADRPDVVAGVAEEFEAIGAEAFARVCEAVAAADQFPEIARIRAPTLVVSAAHDPFVPPGHGRRLAAGISGARFTLLRGAAHLAGVERPDRVNDMLMEHLGV